MSLLAVLALGFFLGMRHATDADHVVAVTTIVSRESTVRAAMMIGALWGIGHTVTILVVGGSIITRYGKGHRRAQPGLRPVPRLPDWNRRGLFSGAPHWIPK
jgi:high-affinity nickel permease